MSKVDNKSDPVEFLARLIYIYKDGDKQLLIATPIYVAQAEIGPTPYKGLEAFDEGDESRFFGRERLVRNIFKKFNKLHEIPRDDFRSPRFLAICGPSGSGKSSVVKAGLIPLLRKQGIHVEVFTPGVHPLETLASTLSLTLARFAGYNSTPMTEQIHKFAKTMERQNRKGEYDGLRQIIKYILPFFREDENTSIPNPPIVLMIDQFEELYSLCEDSEEHQIFIENLFCVAGDASGQVSIVLTLRSDFFGQIRNHPELSQAIADHAVIVPAMNREELRMAIAEPAKAAGYPLDEGTVRLLISESEEHEGSLPLLEFALTRIWEGLAEGSEPADTLEHIDGVGGALAGEAQRIYDNLNQKNRQIAKRIFLSLVHPGEGAKDTRRRVAFSELVAQGESSEQVKHILHLFSRPGTRLITLSSDSKGVETAEVSHEALFEHWKTLKDWLRQERDEIRFHRRLEASARHWENQEKPAGLLWRSPDLDTLRIFFRRKGEYLTASQSEFFRASEKRERSAKGLRRSVIAALALLTMISGIGVFWASRAEIQANAERDKALRNQSLSLAALAEIEIEKGNATNGVLLALEALPKNMEKPDKTFVFRAYTVLYRGISNLHERLVLHHKDKVSSASFSQDGRKIVTASHDGTACVWDSETGVRLALLKGHGGDVLTASFSPDNAKILTASSDGTARVWDSENGELLGILEHDQQVNTAKFSPDGKRIVTASNDGRSRIWDIDNFQIRYEFEHREEMACESEGEVEKKHPSELCEFGYNRINTASFSPDGRQLLTGAGRLRIRSLLNLAEREGEVRTWDVETGRLLNKFGSYEVFEAAFSPNGKMLLTLDAVDVRVWEMETGKLITALEGHKNPINTAVFSQDSQKLLTASGCNRWFQKEFHDNTARVWDIRSGRQLAALHGHREGVTGAFFSPDTRKVASISGNIIESKHSEDNTVRVWNPETGSEIDLLGEHDGAILNASFDREGQKIVGASNDGTARVWNIDPVNLLIRLKHKHPVIKSEFSPNGQKIATISENTISDSASHDDHPLKSNMIHIWDIKTGKRFDLSKETGRVEAVSFNPNSQQLLAVCDSDRLSADSQNDSGKNIYLWDARSGRLILDSEGIKADFAPDGNLIFTISRGKTMCLWDTKIGKKVATLKHKSNIRKADFSSDSRQMLSITSDKHIYIWDVENTVKIALLKGKDAEFSPDSQKIVTTSGNKNAVLWKTENGKRLAILKHKSEVRAVDFSPGGQNIVTLTSDDLIHLWDIKSLQKFAMLDPWAQYMKKDPQSMMAKGVDQILYGSDNRRMVTTLILHRTNTDVFEEIMYLWDIKNAKSILGVKKLLFRKIRFSPNSRLLLTIPANSVDNALDLWDSETGKRLVSIKSHEAKINHAEFSPDSSHLLTASDDGTVRIWRVFGAPQELLDYANKVVPRRLTQEQREKIFRNRL